MTDNEQEPARRLARLLDHLPPVSVLEAAARPIYDVMRTPPAGAPEQHVYGRGLVVVERWPWTKVDAGGETLDKGLRLVVLRNRQLRLQRITGRRDRAAGETWEAKSDLVDVDQILEHWTVEEVRAGIFRVLEECKRPPLRIVTLLEATQAAVDPDARRELWGKDDDGSTRMERLCALFPSLHRAPGARPWSALKMLQYACSGASHGERLAAKFVLGVWHATDWQQVARDEGVLKSDETLRPFDVFEAMNVWDEKNREAMLTWLRDPFWP